jgi:hypothetical protein
MLDLIFTAFLVLNLYDVDDVIIIVFFCMH